MNLLLRPFLRPPGSVYRTVPLPTFQDDEDDELLPLLVAIIDASQEP